MEYEAIREFPDRAIAWLLEDPRRMGSFLSLALPGLAVRTDPKSLRGLSAKLIASSFHKREEDVIYEARTHTGEAIEFFVLVAHQSRSDALIALRLFEACSLLTLRQARLLLQDGALSKKLSRIVPIILHTGSFSWTPSRLADLFESGPQEGLVPGQDFQPHILNLADRGLDELLGHGGLVSPLLALFKEEHRGPEALCEALDGILRRLQTEPRDDFLRGAFFTQQFITHRVEEPMATTMRELIDARVGREEAERMGQTPAQILMEKGRVEGRVESFAMIIAQKYPKHKAAATQRRLERIGSDEVWAKLSRRLLEDLTWDEFWAD